MAEDAASFCMKINYYNRRQKRACKSKPVHPIILKKATTDTKGFGSSDFCRRRKVAGKSEVVVSPREDDVDLGLVLKKRKPCSSRHGVLQDSELDSRVFAFQSASGESDYSDKKQGIEESLARICNSKDALRVCGSLDDYEKLDGISRGAFGAVYRARDKRTGEIVAMKEQFDGMSVPTLREIDIMTSLGRHPAIVEFKEAVADDSDGVYIIMECMECDLHDYLEAAGERLNAADIKVLMLQLLEGVKFLHDNKVMHRDLKPSNVLIGRNGVLKICDFGLSRRMDATSELYTPHVGTGWYRAPELLMGAKDYTEAVDMWAVGCIMAEILLRYGGDWEKGKLERICRIVGEGEGAYDLLRSKYFPATVVTEAGFELLMELLCCHSGMRITADCALTHIWFEEEDS